MNRPTLHAPLTFLVPPLKPSVRDVVVNAGADTTRDLTLDFA
jgi:hypothetical protein